MHLISVEDIHRVGERQRLSQVIENLLFIIFKQMEFEIQFHYLWLCWGSRIKVSWAWRVILLRSWEDWSLVPFPSWVTWGSLHSLLNGHNYIGEGWEEFLRCSVPEPTLLSVLPLSHSAPFNRTMLDWNTEPSLDTGLQTSELYIWRCWLRSFPLLHSVTVFFVCFLNF